MVKRISAATVAAVVAVLLGGIHSVASAGFDENLNAYTLDTVVVEGSQAKNKFGFYNKCWGLVDTPVHKTPCLTIK